MCTFRQLYYGEDGYLIICTDCQHFQLAFQTSLLTFTAPDLHVFHSLVKENYELNYYETSPPRKNIYIPTSMDGHGMILTQQELGQLFNILEIAEVNLKTESLLELFK